MALLKDKKVTGLVGKFKAKLHTGTVGYEPHIAACIGV